MQAAEQQEQQAATQQEQQAHQPANRESQAAATQAKHARTHAWMQEFQTQLSLAKRRAPQRQQPWLQERLLHRSFFRFRLKFLWPPLKLARFFLWPLYLYCC
jgi:hypothetical protein